MFPIIAMGFLISLWRKEGKNTMKHSVLRKDYDTLHRDEHYVRFFSQEERIQFIDMLERDGFTFTKAAWADKQACLNTSFPLAVHLKNKTIAHLGSVTCSACASTSGVLLNTDEFMQIYRKER